MADNRIHRIVGAQQSQLVFKQLTGVERLGQPYCYLVELLSEKRDLSPYDVIGQKMAVVIEPEGQPKRFFHGHVTAFRNVGASGGYQRYEAELRPWLWLLNHSRDCRIFQAKSAMEIIESIFKEKNGFTDFRSSCDKQFEKREYCVQYRESDFAFVSRLMEQEGIYYYFEHEENKHTLVMVDANKSHPSISGSDKLPFRPPTGATSGNDFVYYWQHHVEVLPSQFSLRDFDYNKPATLLEAKSRTGHSHLSKGEVYDYPGSFEEAAAGRTNADLIKQSSDAQVAYMRGQARSYQLGSGKLFKLFDHPRDAENIEYLVFEAETTIQSGEIEQFTVESKNVADVKFLALPKTQQFRSPRTTPSPIIAGPQTAIVVGKQGEEIWTDALGRIKVQFHWDRQGQKDENSSCWVRVSQYWAGQNWGSIHIPRIGQEVIVEFLEGDPDRPIVTGRVYNTSQTVPYDLPNLATQSGIKSRSTPDGDAATFNELRFDDKKNEESIYFHAERDFTRIVENDDVLKVGFEKKEQGNQTIEIFRDQVLKVGTSESNGSQTLEVFKDQTESIKTGNRTITIEKGNDTLTISKGNNDITVSEGSQSVTISKGNQTTSIPSGNCEITAGPNIKLTANSKIELTVGGSKITIEPAKISIESTEILIKASGQMTVQGSLTDVKGSGVLKLEGGVVKIN